VSNPTRVNFNTLEQAVSSDMNRVGALAGFNLQELVRDLGNGIDGGLTPPTAVARGLKATPGAGMSLDISTGTAYLYSTATDGDSSPYRISKLTTTTSLEIAAADGTHSRIDLVSFHDAVESTDSTTRNELTLPDRTVSAVAVDKTKRPSMVLTVTTGTPGATPAFPSVPAGDKALWYVRVPAGATTLDEADLMDMRTPLAPASVARSHGRLSGLYMGVNDPGVGLTCSIGSGLAIVNGVMVNYKARRSFGTSWIDSIVATAGTPTGLAADTEYCFYGVATGGGSPVGKTIEDGLIPVISDVLPTAAGKPASAISYYPLAAAYQTFPASTEVVATTANALYLGSFWTDSQGYPIDTGIPLNADGTDSLPWASVANYPGGMLGQGWLTRPTLTYSSATTVIVGTGVALVRGSPCPTPYASAVMGSSFVTGVSESSSTWYYVYMRAVRSQSAHGRGVCRTFVPKISTAAPTIYGTYGGTPESGFTTSDYVYVGSFYNDGSSNILPFRKTGMTTYFRDESSTLRVFSHNMSSYEEPTRATVTCLVPPTARVAIIKAIGAISNAGGASLQTIHLCPETGNAVPTYGWDLVCGITGGGASTTSHELVRHQLVTAAGAFEVSGEAITGGTTPTATLAINSVGYIEDV